MANKVSIILSTYNEAKVIEKTIDEIFKHIDGVEIILVDDSSTDGTLEKVKKINNPNLKIYSRKFRGLASAFLLGLINSSGDIVGWIDSNMDTLVKQLPEMIKKLSDNDIVLLSRYIQGGGDKRTQTRIITSKIINFICRIVLSSKIKDYTSGIFVMKREALSSVVPIGYGHGDFFIEFIYQAKKRGLKLLEVPCIQPSDQESLSKTAPNIFRFIKVGFFYLLRVFQATLNRK